MSAPHGSGIICCVQNIHVRQLIRRIHWLVRVRWAVAATLLAATLLATLPLGHTIDTRPLFAGVLFLLLANTVFRRRARRAEAECVGTHEMRRDGLAQIVVDYLVLAVVVYTLGSIETPAMFMVLPNIILAALFFTRTQSLFIALMGYAFISSPLLLEVAGVLPVVSIYPGGFKHAVLANPAILFDFLVLLAACVLFCWYLVSTITGCLIRNELELEENYQTMLRLDEEKTRATLRGTHELKAPLAAIKGYCYTLRDGYAGPLPERAKAVVERMALRCDRLLAKITDIIRLSNLKTYVYTGEQYHPVDVRALLEHEVAEARTAGALRDVGVTLDAPADPLLLRGSEEHFATLIGNLLANAVNYSHEGGAVRVRLGAGARGGATLEVEDHGIGIPAEALPHIFDDHYRAANAAAHHDGGTGLGLPIVRATAKLLGARLDVHSEPEVGTVFTVEFPHSAT